jgi:hypothetical protein
LVAHLRLGKRTRLEGSLRRSALVRTCCAAFLRCVLRAERRPRAGCPRVHKIMRACPRAAVYYAV